MTNKWAVANLSPSTWKGPLVASRRRASGLRLTCMKCVSSGRHLATSQPDHSCKAGRFVEGPGCVNAGFHIGRK